MQKVASSEEFLEAWKAESDECAAGIFTSLPIEGPEIHGDLKEAAIDNIMRVVWFRIESMTDEERGEALWSNLDAVKKYTSELVDRTVAERWARLESVSK